MGKMKVSGGALVFIGAVLWSLNAPLVKFLAADPLMICALRSVIAGLTLAPLIRPGKLNWGPWMLLYVGSYCALCVSIIVALSGTSAAIAIGMQYTATVWLFLIQLLTTTRFRLRAFLPVCVILTGVIFFMSTGGAGAEGHANLIALMEGIFFAAMTISSKKAAGKNPIGLTAVANLFTGVCVFAFSPSALGHVAELSYREWGIMLILGVVQVAGGYAFYNMGVQKVTASRASIIALWEMILGPIWVAVFLKEYPQIAVVIGFLIIIAGIVLDVRWNTEQSPAISESPEMENLRSRQVKN